jgi:hypothetical protein
VLISFTGPINTPYWGTKRPGYDFFGFGTKIMWVLAKIELEDGSAWLTMLEI